MYALHIYTVPSGAPVNVRAIAATSRTVQVTWDPLPASQQNGPMLHYVVMVMVEQTHATFTLNVTSTSTIIPNVHPSYNYSIKVAAATTVNTGPFSRPLTIKTPDDGEMHISPNMRTWLICILFFSSNWTS